MKCLFLLGLLAVSSVWALPNSAKENEGEKLAFNERIKREVAADAVGKPEGERDTGGKGDAEASGGSSELDLDVDINVGGSRGKSDIDISVNVGSAKKKKIPNKPQPEKGETDKGEEWQNDSQPEKGETDPCDCVKPFRKSAGSLNKHLASLIDALRTLNEAAASNNGTTIPSPGASSSAVAEVDFLKDDISVTLQNLADYWDLYCGYLQHYYGRVQGCRNYRKMNSTLFPRPGTMEPEDSRSPLCIVGDLVTIQKEIADMTETAELLSAQAVNDPPITGNLLSDIDDMIGNLEEQKEKVENMMDEIKELPC